MADGIAGIPTAGMALVGTGAASVHAWAFAGADRSAGVVGIGAVVRTGITVICMGIGAITEVRTLIRAQIAAPH